MSSPDWTPYVDLTLYDQDAVSIFEESLNYARSLIPEWYPQPGNIEVILLEAMAVQTANAVAAINRLPGATTETLLKLFGVTRSNGVKATATISVVATDTRGHVIPARTIFTYLPGGERLPLSYRTIEDLTIPNGVAGGSVEVEALSVGESYNQPSIGSSLQVMTSMPFLRSTQFVTKPTGGRGAETDTEFFARAINTLRSYSAAMSTASQIESYLLTAWVPPVYRCKVYDLSRTGDRDTSDPDWTEEAHPGHALVVVAAENALSSSFEDVLLDVVQRESIAVDLANRINAGLKIDVENVVLVPVAVNLVVKKTSAYTVTSVRDAIIASLNGYLAPNSWPWASSVRVNEIVSLVDRVPGVDYVDSVDSISSTGYAANDGNGNLVFDYLGSLPYPDTASFSVSVT